MFMVSYMCNISFCAGIIHCVLCMFICDLLAVQCFKENIHSCHPVLRVIEIIACAFLIITMFAHCHYNKYTRMAFCILSLVCFGVIFLLGNAEGLVSLQFLRKQGLSDPVGVNFKHATFMRVLFSLFRLKLCITDIRKDRRRKEEGKRVRFALENNRDNNLTSDTVNGDENITDIVV